jgi:hypothetical protein
MPDAYEASPYTRDYLQRRARGAHRNVRGTALRRFAQAWRAEHERRGVTIEELLDALDRLAATTRTTENMPPSG